MNHLLQVTITGLNTVYNSLERREAKEEQAADILHEMASSHAEDALESLDADQIKEALDSYTVDRIYEVYQENEFTDVLETVEFCLREYWFDIFVQEYKDKQQ